MEDQHRVEKILGSIILILAPGQLEVMLYKFYELYALTWVDHLLEIKWLAVYTNLFFKTKKVKSHKYSYRVQRFANNQPQFNIKYYKDNMSNVEIEKSSCWLKNISDLIPATCRNNSRDNKGLKCFLNI